ncbi:MAG: LCCL domain-containing protein, partial [Novosphingobium sp.]|nr:LCCL domain-containing protein [Novosphingobium sp.]
MKKLVFALMGFALGLGALFLVTPEQITSPAKAQQYPRGAQSLGNCPANAKAYRGTGGTYTCGCNSAATGSGSVWGTGTYTDDSSICRAALHAGMISNRGGQVTFSVMGGLASYRGSNRNGVSST